jgi:hypothetical protein
MVEGYVRVRVRACLLACMTYYAVPIRVRPALSDSWPLTLMSGHQPGGGA